MRPIQRPVSYAVAKMLWSLPSTVVLVSVCKSGLSAGSSRMLHTDFREDPFHALR